MERAPCGDPSFVNHVRRGLNLWYRSHPTISRHRWATWSSPKSRGGHFLSGVWWIYGPLHLQELFRIASHFLFVIHLLPDFKGFAVPDPAPALHQWQTCVSDHNRFFAGWVEITASPTIIIISVTLKLEWFLIIIIIFIYTAPSQPSKAGAGHSHTPFTIIPVFSLTISLSRSFQSSLHPTIDEP